MKRCRLFFVAVLGVFLLLPLVGRADTEGVSEGVLVPEKRVELLSAKPLEQPQIVGINSFEGKILEDLTRDLKTVDLYKRIAQTIFVIVLGYLLYLLLSRLVHKKVKNLKARHTLRKNTAYFTTILVTLFIFFIWVHKLQTLTIFLGVAGAGLALALQETILCMAGWLLIITRHPFEVGDRVELSGVKGDVIDIRLFQTSLLEIGNWVEADQSTGRIVNIPNSTVFKKENFNYNRGFEYIWDEIKVMVTFESDRRRAEEILLSRVGELAEGKEDIVKRRIDNMGRHYMIYYDKLTPIVYTKIKDSGVEFSLRYLTEAKKRRITENALSRQILDDFEKEPNVNFAYTTYRLVK